MTQALEFLQTVLPDKGYYCLAKPITITDKETGQSINTWQHQVVETVEALAKVSKSLSDTKADIYFAVGSLKEPKVWNEEKKKHQYRTHANISHFKSLFVDLDCGGADKPFKTQKAALAALKSFCQESGFFKPTYIVNSGGGLHCYWSFDESITADQWFGFAERFRVICDHFKLEYDPTRIVDKSSVLRVPDTNNWKKAEPRPVTVLLKAETYKAVDVMANIKEIFASNNLVLDRPKPFAQPDGIAWPKNLAPPADYDADLIYERCPQMARVKEIGGPVGYPVRTCAVSIIKMTMQQDYSVLWANDPNEQTVINQTEQMKNDSVSDNPSTCERFKEFNPTGCARCAYAGKVKSPIRLGIKLLSAFDEPKEPETVVEEVTVPKSEVIKETRSRTVTYDNRTYTLYDPPEPYTHTKDGRVFGMGAIVKGEEETMIEVADFMIAPIEICKNRRQQDADSVRVYVNAGLGGEGVYEFPSFVFSDNSAFRKAISSNGIFLRGSDKSTTLINYMVSYIKHLQKMIQPSETYGSLGWDSDDFNYFVTPNGRYLPSGEFIPASTSLSISNAMEGFKTKGSFEEWRSVIDVYTKPGYEDYAFGHLVAYGSLLFPLSGLSGALVNMVGNTGSGKSTVLQTINSVFGIPTTYLTQQDTENAQMNRLGIYKNYPVTYDEITNIDAARLSPFVYSVSQGRSKLRLDQNANEKISGNTTWQMIMASTSNSNLIDKLASFKQDASAEAARIFQFYIHRREEMNNIEARNTFGKLLRNYGHAGDIFIKEIVTKIPETQALYDKILVEVDRLSGATQSERFWTAIVASCVTGGIIARKLGLHSFNMNAIMNWGVEQIKLMRASMSETISTPQSLLVDFLNSCINRTLVLGGGTSVYGKDSGFFVTFEPTDAVWCRLENDLDTMYMDRRKFRDYITKGGSDFNTIKKLLHEMRIVLDTDVNKVLTKDSNKAKSGSTKCWKINLAHKDMAGALLIQVPENRPITGDRQA